MKVGVKRDKNKKTKEKGVLVMLDRWLLLDEWGVRENRRRRER